MSSQVNEFSNSVVSCNSISTYFKYEYIFADIEMELIAQSEHFVCGGINTDNEKGLKCVRK